MLKIILFNFLILEICIGFICFLWCMYVKIYEVRKNNADYSWDEKEVNCKYPRYYWAKENAIFVFGVIQFFFIPIFYGICILIY